MFGLDMDNRFIVKASSIKLINCRSKAMDSYL